MKKLMVLFILLSGSCHTMDFETCSKVMRIHLSDIKNSDDSKYNKDQKIRALLQGLTGARTGFDANNDIFINYYKIGDSISGILMFRDLKPCANNALIDAKMKPYLKYIEE